MYLDNVIKSAQTASMPEVTYSEIMEDTLRMVEVEGAGELALLKAEATAHIMGSEAPSDWWAKIKVVARKIFEMLKNLITKVFAFIKTIPTKVGTLITRLMTKWEKLGMKSKIDRVLKKSGVEVRYAAAKDLKDREFSKFYGLTKGEGSTGKDLRNKYQALNKAISDATTAIGKLDPENDNYTERKQQALESVISAQNAVKDAKQKFKDETWKPFESAITGDDTSANNKAIAAGLIKFMEAEWADLKNRVWEKEAEKCARSYESIVRQHASAYRTAMSGYERAVKDENEKAVRGKLEEAKTYRQTLSFCASASANEAALYYSNALLSAKLVNACLACFKGGNANGKKTY